MIKVLINNVQYTKVKVVSFASESTITNNELPINQAIVEINTTDNIEVGDDFYLYKGSTLLARYFVTDVYSTNKNFLRVEASSILIYLDRDILPPVMYNNASFSSVISSIFQNTESKLGTIHSLDSSITATISGYCPEQTARQRLQWVCFVAGAAVQTEFSNVIQIKSIDTSVSLIPANRTFWIPTINYKDYVTAIRLKYYSYEARTPGTTDSWIKVGNTYYVETVGENVGQNDDVPQGTRDNVISIEDITLINPNNALNILARLEAFYFSRLEITADILNLTDYLPLDRVQVGNNSMLVDGYIKSSVYSFGNSSKTKIIVEQYSDVDFVTITIEFDSEADIPSVVMVLPENYEFEYDIDYFDIYDNGVRYILRPSTSHISLVVPSVDTTIPVTCYTELSFSNNDLTVLSVDSVTQTSEGVVKIG